MKVQEVVDGLNMLAERLPRIVTTMILQTIPIDLSELKDVSGWDERGVRSEQRALNVMFRFGHGSSPTMSFADLISGMCDDGTITYKIEGGKVRFDVGPGWCLPSAIKG